MIFHEIYSSYFDAVSSILTEATQGTLMEQKIADIVLEKAFGESILTIPQNLKDGTWPLLTKDWETPLQHSPSQPLTLLQKRWLKALLSDPRIRLFSPDTTGWRISSLCTLLMFLYISTDMQTAIPMKMRTISIISARYSLL